MDVCGSGVCVVVASKPEERCVFAEIEIIYFDSFWKNKQNVFFNLL